MLPSLDNNSKTSTIIRKHNKDEAACNHFNHTTFACYKCYILTGSLNGNVGSGFAPSIVPDENTTYEKIDLYGYENLRQKFFGVGSDHYSELC